MASVINAVHALIYADDPEATRAFFRDVLEFPGVTTETGWLILKSGPSQVTVHPRGWEQEGDTAPPSQQVDLSLMCDDLDETMAQLAAKGAEFSGDVSDEGWGLTVLLKVPGTGEMMLYQPKYGPTASSL